MMILLLCVLTAKFSTFVKSIAHLHEISDADIDDEKTVLDMMMYAEVRLRPSKGRMKGKGKGSRGAKWTRQSVFLVVSWVSICR